MSNAEQVAHQSMLRDCENSMFGGDVQDDAVCDECGENVLGGSAERYYMPSSNAALLHGLRRSMA